MLEVRQELLENIASDMNMSERLRCSVGQQTLNSDISDNGDNVSTWAVLRQAQASDPCGRRYIQEWKGGQNLGLGSIKDWENVKMDAF